MVEALKPATGVQCVVPRVDPLDPFLQFTEEAGDGNDVGGARRAELRLDVESFCPPDPVERFLLGAGLFRHDGGVVGDMQSEARRVPEGQRGVAFRLCGG